MNIKVRVRMYPMIGLLLLLSGQVLGQYTPQGSAPRDPGSGPIHDRGMQALQRGDYQTAYAAFSEMAQQGDPDGVFHLGVMHEAGEGVQPSLQEAYARYYMAGTRGHAMAAQYARDLEQTMPPAVVGKIRSQVDTRRAGNSTRPPAAPRDPRPQNPFNGQYDRPKGSVGSTPPYWPMPPKPEPRSQSQPNNSGSQHDRYPQPNEK